MPTARQKLKRIYKRSSDWSKEHLKSYSIKFNRETEGDIIAFLDSLENKKELLTKLIRKELKK